VKDRSQLEVEIHRNFACIMVCLAHKSHFVCFATSMQPEVVHFMHMLLPYLCPKRSSPICACFFKPHLSSSESKSGLLRIPQHQNNGVATKKHLANEAILVHRSGLVLSLACFGNLSPHFFYVLEHHIAMPIEGLHSSQKLAIVSAVDQHLSVTLDALCEK